MIDRTWLIARGFTGFIGVKDLRAGRLVEIPADPGVYAVLRECSGHPGFLTQSIGGHFKGKDPTVLRSTLVQSWIPESQVVYIGKAGHIDRGPTLQRRIRQYLDFGEGKPIGHWGGRYIWQLEESSNLLFSWQVIPGVAPRSIERDLIADFAKTTGKLPFANLKR